MSALSAAVSAPSRSEQELISAVRRGDDRAFEELYARYRQRIGSYVFGMVGDHQRAEDLAQEVFIAALRRLRATERPIAFKPWIYEIAKNACIDEFRRARRAQEVPLESDREDVTPTRLIAHGADAAVEHKQRLDDLRGAFHGLSESHHRIIVMRELEGRSYTQIGESLGLSKPVVESTLFRARRKLSEEYEELVTGRRCERVQGVIAADGDRPLRSLGIKERRLLARHLAHCQPCRRHARMAGVDESFFKTPSIAAKIAALLPLPWLRLRRGGGGATGPSASGAQSVAAMQSLQNVANYVDPSGPAAGVSRAVAAAAAIVVAGAGGGLVTGAAQHNQMPRPPVVHSVPARASQSHVSRVGAAMAQPASVTTWQGGASGQGTRRPKDRIKRSGGSSGGSGSGSGHSGGGSSASGSSGGSASKSSSSGSQSSISSATNGAGTAVHNPLSAAAGAASRLLSGASSGSGGSSGSSGSGVQLPSAGPVSLPKLPVNLPSGSTSSSGSTTSSGSSTSSTSSTISVPSVPGVPDPNKLISSLTGS